MSSPTQSSQNGNERVRHEVRTSRDVQTRLRLAFTPNEAAFALGCSREFFEEHLGPERWTRRGRLAQVRRFA